MSARTLEIAIRAEDKEYRTYIYNRIDGKMVDKVVTATEAEEYIKEGWALTPAAFSEDEEMKETLEFNSACDSMANILNVLLNIDVCDDKVVLMDVGNNYLGLKLKESLKVKTMRYRIKKKAKEEGFA